MTQLKRHIVAMAASILFLGSQSAFAGDPGTVYLGLGLGSSHSDYSTSDCIKDLQNAGASSSSISCTVTQDSAAAKIFAGINITPNAAIELTSAALGDLHATIKGPAATIVLTDKVDILALELVGKTTPNDSRFFFSGRIGAFNANSETSADNAAITSESSSNTGLSLGFGIGYEISNHAQLRLDFNHFRGVGTEDTIQMNPDMLTAVFAYTF